MTKRQLIDEIVGLNPTAEPGFLARFEDGQLQEYLGHLNRAKTPRLSGNPQRYEKYFTPRLDKTASPAAPTPAPVQIVASTPQPRRTVRTTLFEAVDPAESVAPQAERAQAEASGTEEPAASEPAAERVQAESSLAGQSLATPQAAPADPADSAEPVAVATTAASPADESDLWLY